ncbi:MAG: prephenate dehydrogenase [Clostridia bacterium]|nr:prephenate dehydrogenase [Clostridia bacterium]
MNIGIVGLGLIGGSLGRCITSKTDHVVYGADISEQALKTGKLLSAYKKQLNFSNAHELDIIFFALYPRAVVNAIQSYLPYLKDGCIVMDCCGNKREVDAFFKTASVQYPLLEFIGAHPMAGREFSGIKHSTAYLFDRASMILTPIKASIKTVAFVKAFSFEIGFGQVVITTAEEHDRIIAYTSQLAHIVSSAYIKSPTAQSFMGFSAGSFRDMTRVARLSPEMWSQLMHDNRDNLVREIDVMIKSLTEYKNALANGDEALLKQLLADGNDKKLSAERLRNKQNDKN